MNDNQDKPKITIVDLPEGAYRPALTDPKPMRWPKQLWADLFKLCNKANTSVPKLIIALCTEFRDKNKNLLK